MRDSDVPALSRYLGIVIVMYYRDHDPPHFHAKYGEYEVTVEIISGAVSGNFPRRSLRHLLDWHELHTDELLQNWHLAKRSEQLMPIAPLE